MKSAEGINATSLSSTTIALSWSPPLPEYQNGIIILYRINLTTSQGATQHYTSANTSITITGLMPHSSYSCVIAAENSAGVGPYSSPVVVQTAEAGKTRIGNVYIFYYYIFSAPSAAPVNVSLSVVSPTAVNLTWSPPPMQHHNGIIVSYIVAVTEVVTDTTYTITTSDTSLTVDSLHPYYSYVLKVAAITVEQGPYSNKTSATTPQDGMLLLI